MQNRTMYFQQPDTSIPTKRSKATKKRTKRNNKDIFVCMQNKKE